MRVIFALDVDAEKVWVTDVRVFRETHPGRSASHALTGSPPTGFREWSDD